MTTEFPIGKTLHDAAPQTARSDSPQLHTPKPWIFPTRSIAIRLFFTCWLVYSVHVATNTVREIFPALAMADHFSFRLDEYANFSPDLFEKPGYGWHITGNPGASMLAAIPYFLSRPIVDPIVAAVNRSRAANHNEPPSYNSPWPMAREFYRQAWRRGFDVKFGLAAVIMQTFCMAPISALGVVAMFYLLGYLFGSDRAAFWLALLYAFGTPVFYRAALLNQNMMIGHFSLMALMAMWNPGGSRRLKETTRYLLAGLAGGMAVLLDYSGAIVLLGLFCYAVSRMWARGSLVKNAHIWRFALGATVPVAFLLFYQWKCFGNPLYPCEHWMPEPAWQAAMGYRGFTLPQLHLFLQLLGDYRFGIFTTCPLLLLSICALWMDRGTRRVFPARESIAMWSISAALILFFSGWTSVWMQFTYGMRYLAPLLPFLYLLTAVVMVRMPRRLALLLASLAVTQAWCMAMYRDVERGFGVFDPALRVFIGGFQLPALTVFARMSGQYGDYAAMGVSPLAIFAVVAAIIAVIWSGRRLVVPPVPEGTR